MATRFYYVANTVASVSPAFQGTYEDTGQAVRRTMDTVKNATTEILSGSLSGDNGSSALVVQLISAPLTAGQTITGNMSINSRGRELAATDNIDQRYRMVYLVSEDGTTFRSTLITAGVGGGTTELSTTVTAQQHLSSVAVTSQTTADGDRLVIELGYGETGLGATPQWAMTLGGNGTDQVNTSNDSTGQVPWAELSAFDLTFKGATTKAPTNRPNTMPRGILTR